MKEMRGLASLFVLAGLLMTASMEPANAQDQAQPTRQADNVGLDMGGSDLSLEITADNGIEWEQRQAVVRARGNARAVRGDVSVKANVLSAYYREKPDGQTEIWRLDAAGDVEIMSTTDTAYAERGQYDVDSAVLVLSGSDGVRLIGKDGQVTAEKQVEYWQAKRMLVARGNAEAIQGDKRIRADVLVAYLRDDADGKTALDRVEAFDRVRVVTAEEEVRGARGVYDATSGTAALTGAVKITRGKNQLNGCRAEVNLNTGISKLFACGGSGTSGGRVQGLIQPEQVKKK